MGFVDKLNRLLGLFGTPFKHIYKPALWWPFFIYAVLQFVALYLLKSHINPSLYPVLEPVISIFSETRAQVFDHYPQLYLLLPYFYQWWKLCLGIIFEGLAVGLTTLLFLKAMSLPQGRGLRVGDAFKKWPTLLITWAIITAILFAINYFIPQLARDFLYGSPRRMLLFDIALRLLTILIYAPLIYAVPAIIILKRNIIGAFSSTFSLFGKMPIFSFFIALIPYLFTVPFQLLAGRSDMIVSKFAPELVFYILLAGIIVEMIVNFVFTGALTRLISEEFEEE